MERGPIWLSALLGVMLLSPALTAAAAEQKDAPPDADMLVNLDLLAEADLAKQRTFLRQLGMLEWLRLLERLPLLDSLTPIAPVQKEEK